MEKNGNSATDNQPEDDLDMDLGPEPEGPPVTRPEPPKPKKKHNKKMIIAWVLAVLMTIAAGVFAWLYFTKEDTHTHDEQETSEQAEEQTQEATDEEESAEQQTVYEAEVGKFTLDLDPSYVIIERLDGPFEGGPATIIDIAETTDTSGVVETNPAQAFTLFARPEDGATLASNSRTFAMEDNELATRLDDSEFAGETARVYQVDGLFSIRHIIWVKNGNVYEITHVSEDETHAAMLRVVETGFSFVE